MYLRKNYRKDTGRTYLSIVHGYRNELGKSTSKTIKSIGYLDDLEKEYDDPIAHFTEVAKQMDEERNAGKTYDFSVPKDANVDKNSVNRKNYGHVVFSNVYHELELDRFLKNKRRHENFEFNTDSIMRLLVFSRLLYPDSKKGTFEMRGKFFDNFKFSLDDVYHCLTHFDAIGISAQRHIHEMITAKYGRDMELVYYDVTNYYFESDIQDDLKRRGAEKNHRPDPIVQVGLAMDKQGIPITYRQFPGNTHDSETLMPALKEVKKTFNAGRIIVVADKGLNCGDNIAYNLALGDGYIYSKSVRGADKEVKAYVLDEEGYEYIGKSYKKKSRVTPTEINVTKEQIGKKKKKKKVSIDQKQIVFYSEKYAARSKHKRDESVAKARELICDPSKYRKATSYGVAGYIVGIKYDDDGVIITPKEQLYIDEEKIREDAKWDGYYLIVTSELDAPDEHIIDTYQGLWRIEESFKVTKSILHTRPMFVWTQAHINAHLLICFIALVIARIVEIKLGRKYGIERIVETLRAVECSRIDQNYFLFDYADDITEDMNAVFGTDFGKKIMPLKKIRKNLGMAKKG
jgi:transposase